jgi:ribosomal protein L2
MFSKKLLRYFDCVLDTGKVEFIPLGTRCLRPYMRRYLSLFALLPGNHALMSESIDPGNAMPAGNIPMGTIVHNIETRRGTSEIAKASNATRHCRR